VRFRLVNYVFAKNIEWVGWLFGQWAQFRTGRKTAKKMTAVYLQRRRAHEISRSWSRWKLRRDAKKIKDGIEHVEILELANSTLTNNLEVAHGKISKYT
jgi:hypothetical protein